MKYIFPTALLLTFAPVQATSVQQYRYDAMGRLISIEQRLQGGNGGRTFYAYDASSNRKRVSASGPYKPVQIIGGTELNNGEGILSTDARFLFIFQDDGNLVLYDQNMAPIWNAGTQNTGASRMAMQTDGNLVIYRADGPVWFTRTDGSGGKRLTVQNDGNVVIYTDAGQPVWNSGTCCR